MDVNEELKFLCFWVGGGGGGVGLGGGSDVNKELKLL